MSTAKHTPGPWRIAKGKLLSGNLHLAYIDEAPGLGHAAEANATLLAAAPELLAALKRLMAEVVWSVPHEDTLDQARKAITKAEGRP